MLAEAFAVNIKQAAAVVGLLLLHAVEDAPPKRGILPQTVGEVGNAGVLLLKPIAKARTSRSLKLSKLRMPL